MLTIKRMQIKIRTKHVSNSHLPTCAADPHREAGNNKHMKAGNQAVINKHVLLVVAHKLTTSREMLLWMTPSEAPKALQASECSELRDPKRASCWIFAQH